MVKNRLTKFCSNEAVRLQRFWKTWTVFLTNKIGKGEKKFNVSIINYAKQMIVKGKYIIAKNNVFIFVVVFIVYFLILNKKKNISKLENIHQLQLRSIVFFSVKTPMTNRMFKSQYIVDAFTMHVRTVLFMFE